MDKTCLVRVTIPLQTRQTKPDGEFIWGTDPDVLCLEVLEERLAAKPDATIVRITCPTLYSDPSEYSYSWYRKYPGLTFEFVGPRAAQFEYAAKAARARRELSF
jgi:hypothetical protein